MNQLTLGVVISLFVLIIVIFAHIRIRREFNKILQDRQELESERFKFQQEKCLFRIEKDEYLCFVRDLTNHPFIKKSLDELHDIKDPLDIYREMHRSFMEKK